MSQVYIGSSSSNPAIPTSFSTDNGTATPVANIININGCYTSNENNNGLKSNGSGNTVTLCLTNRFTETTTTTDATPTAIITFNLGSTTIFPPTAGPRCVYVYGNVQAFNSSGPASASFSFSGSYETDGTTTLELGTEYTDQFKSAALNTSNVLLSAVGNTIVVSVTGVAATTINWNSLLEYRSVN